MVAVSDLVAERVKELRQRGGWMSTKSFAERCAEIGAPQLSASVLMNIESGRRKDGQRTRTISVDELLALAAALDVSPLVLLLPRSESDYPVTPTLRADAQDVYAWMVARRQGIEESEAGYTTDPLTPAEEDVAAWWNFKRDVPWVHERRDLTQLRRARDYLARVRANEFVALLPNFVVGSPESDERFRRIMGAFPALRDLAPATTTDDFQVAWSSLTEQVRVADAAQIAAITDDETRIALAHLKDLVTAEDEIARSIGDVVKPEVAKGDIGGTTQGVQDRQGQTRP